MAQQQPEFVTAQPSHHIPLAHLPADHPGAFAQQGIARHMAGGIVHHLEAIQVDKAQHAVLRPRLIEGFLQGILKFPAIGEAGQGIVGGVVAQLLLHGPPGGHIPKHHHRPGHLTIRRFKRRRGILNFVAAAVAAL